LFARYVALQKSIASRALPPLSLPGEVYKADAVLSPGALPGQEAYDVPSGKEPVTAPAGGGASTSPYGVSISPERGRDFAPKSPPDIAESGPQGGITGLVRGRATQSAEGGQPPAALNAGGQALERRARAFLPWGGGAAATAASLGDIASESTAEVAGNASRATEPDANLGPPQRWAEATAGGRQAHAEALAAEATGAAHRAAAQRELEAAYEAGVASARSRKKGADLDARLHAQEAARRQQAADVHRRAAIRADRERAELERIASSMDHEAARSAERMEATRDPSAWAVAAAELERATRATPRPKRREATGG
jgi:hypothetical protein